MLDSKQINLLISCPNDGGLVWIHDGVPEYVDDISTTGLCRYEDRVFRCFQNSIDTPLTLIVYGTNGKKTLTFPDIRDAHDILAYDGKIYVVSTGTNEVFVLSSETFSVLDRIKFRGKGDAWHLNCLEVSEGRVLLSAFGKFRRHRGYKGKTVGAGILMDLLSGKILVDGFSQPHSPQVIDGNLFICDSENKSVLRMDTNSGARAKLDFDNYTRGISYSADYVYVGVSSSRNITQESKTSRLVVLDRRTLGRIGEIQLRFGEIYSVCALPENVALVF